MNLLVDFMLAKRLKILSLCRESRFVRGSVWSMLGFFISRLSGLLASILVARILGSVGYGELSLIQGTVGMFSTLAGFGLGLTTTKYVAESKTVSPKRAGGIIGFFLLFSLVSGSFMAFTLSSLSSWFATLIFNTPSLAKILSISSPLLVFNLLTGIQVGALAGFEAFKRIALVNFAGGLLTLPILFAGAYFGGVEGVIYGMLLSNLLTCIINAQSLKAEMAIRGIPLFVLTPKEAREILWRFSLPTLLSSVMVSPVTWVTTVMLVNQIDGYSELGFFNAANQWRQAALIMPGIFLQVLVPIMSDNVANADSDGVRNQMRQSFKVNFVVGLFTTLVLSAISPFVMGFYGDSFKDKWSVLVVLQIVAFVQTMQSPIVAYWAAKGEMWENFGANMVWASAVVMFTWVFLDRGALGLAYGFLGGFVVFGGLVYFKAKSFFARKAEDLNYGLPTV
jgi:O-antigen/teichoic acid export membrane protein